MLEFSKRLDILRNCDMRDITSQMPSWVPNWTVPASSDILFSTAADAQTPAVARDRGDGVLEVVGVEFATVKRAEKLDIGEYSEYKLDKILRLVPHHGLEDPYIGGGSIVEAYCRTFATNTFAERYVPSRPGLPSFVAWIDSFRKLLDSERDIRLFEIDMTASHYTYQFGLFGKGRSFVTTSEGYIGFASQNTQPGDKVCILLGCRSPLIMRRSRNPHCEILGECYLHGAMEGEAILGKLPEQWKHVTYWNEMLQGWFNGYHNAQTNTNQELDPRLEMLARDGEDVGYETHGASRVASILTPERLAEMGVSLTTFSLI